MDARGTNSKFYLQINIQVDRPRTARYSLDMWTRKLEYLRRKGYSDTGIAEECGCTRRQIHRLRIGENREPQYTLGTNIVALEQRVRTAD